jgi:hypothetical protein
VDAFRGAIQKADEDFTEVVLRECPRQALEAHDGPWGNHPDRAHQVVQCALPARVADQLGAAQQFHAQQRWLLGEPRRDRGVSTAGRALARRVPRRCRDGCSPAHRSRAGRFVFRPPLARRSRPACALPFAKPESRAVSTCRSPRAARTVSTSIGALEPLGSRWPEFPESRWSEVPEPATVVATASGILTLVVGLWIRGDPAFAIERMVTVLVIACPHALGLAVPLVVAISTTMGARNGLLVRDRPRCRRGTESHGGGVRQDRDVDAWRASRRRHCHCGRLVSR